jgi:uncharacterized membrane protein
MNQRAAMISIVSCSALQSLLYILLSAYINVNILLVIGVAIFVLVNIWLSKRIRSRKA